MTWAAPVPLLPARLGFGDEPHLPFVAITLRQGAIRIYGNRFYPSTFFPNYLFGISSDSVWATPLTWFSWAILALPGGLGAVAIDLFLCRKLR